MTDPIKVKREPYRHVISLDGTWQRARQKNPTNIKLLHDCLADVGTDRMVQKKVHFDGVATKGNILQRAWNGATGGGLKQQVLEPYQYLVENYQAGDDIVLVGFSRGAFAARTLNGMIYKCGILNETKDLEEAVNDAYKFYRCDKRPSSEESIQFRKEYSQAERPKINLACFDTVGELGIPKQFFILNGISNKFHDFHDTRLNKNTVLALHVLATDEQRANFQPTLMECDDCSNTDLTPLWFIGNHGAAGGGSEENKALSDIAGLWVAKKLAERGNVGYNLEALDRTFKPDYAANPTSDFKPESFLWKIAGFERRDIPKNAEFDMTVLKRFDQVAHYKPQHVEERLIIAVAAAKAASPSSLIT